MKISFTTLALLLLLNLVSKAQIMINENTRIKDENGKVLDFNTWQKLMETNGFGLRESPNEKGTFIIFRLSEEEKEQMAAFMKNAAAGNDMASPYFNTGEPIASFSAVDMEGKGIDLNGLKGKVVVLNFWFVGCAPCRQEIPELNRLVDTYIASGKVEFISIAPDKEADIRKMLKKLPFKYRHIADAKVLVNEKFGVGMFPTHVVVDQNGLVAFHTSGLSPATIESIESSITGLIK